MSEVFVGLDLGTQGARALAATTTGEVVGRASRPLTGHRDEDRHEQDPNAWWDALAAACREALHGIEPSAVHGVATCATSGTIALTTADGAPSGPALMYDDGRASEEARALGMAPSWALPKLRWLVEHGAAAESARLAHQPDVITRRLVGHDVPTDASHALKTGYDVARDAWPQRLARAYGDLLPAVVRPGTRLGFVCAAAAQRTGLPAGTPVIAGMTDGCAAQIAAGALRDGAWNSVLGTTLVLKGVSAQPIDDPHGVVYCHRAPNGSWLPGGASSSGAGVLEAAFPGRDLAELTTRAKDHARTRVIAYSLVGRGERFPFAAPEARSFLSSDPVDEDERFAALLQGLALVERLCFDYLDLLGAPLTGELSLTGGAAANDVLNQLRADVLKRPLRLPRTGESAFGMAILAAAATAGEDVADTAQRMSHTRATVAPDPSRAAHLDEQYARFVAALLRRGWLDERLARHALR